MTRRRATQNCRSDESSASSPRPKRRRKCLDVRVATPGDLITPDVQQVSSCRSPYGTFTPKRVRNYRKEFDARRGPPSPCMSEERRCVVARLRGAISNYGTDFSRVKCRGRITRDDRMRERGLDCLSLHNSCEQTKSY